MDSFVTDTQALVKFMMGKKTIKQDLIQFLSNNKKYCKAISCS